MKIEIIVVAVIVLLALTEPETNNGFTFDSTLPRGIRNNNPANIRIVQGNNWRGKIPESQNTDYEFEQFETMQYGIRAALKLLSNYIRNGYNTINKIISRWAPPTENNTGNYIDAVSKGTGISPNQVISKNRIPDIAYHIFIHENGGVFINENQINSAWSTV